MDQPAKLALEDGTVFTGTSIGADGEVDGEVCFNTSMTGYQEILTDPSYRGQIVTMTYPQIGNYGVNAEDVESQRPQLAGFVVREHSRTQSNFRSEQSLSEYLVQHGIVAIESIDTRSLVRRLRSRGALKGVLSTRDLDDASLLAKAKASPGLVGRDLVREVLPDQPFEWQQPLSEWTHLRREQRGSGGDVDAENTLASRLAPRASTPHVVALDYGMKWNIPRHLVDQGCRVTILPGTATADDVLAQEPDGVFLSNGPGDPEPLEYAIGTIRCLLGQEADLRNLFGASIARVGVRREDFQAQVRPPRCESSRPKSGYPVGGNHVAEPRLRGGGRFVARFFAGNAPQPQRRNDRRPGASRRPGLQRAVPSRSIGRPAR